MAAMDEARRVAFDDSIGLHPRGQIVIIGCGNLLRGDDAVGPITIRHLWTLGVPDEVTLVDGGTAGMDVAFKMRGARLVILIDAATTESKPGTIYEIPGDEIEQLPPLEGMHSHQFRWDHALAFGHWLLGDDYPTDVTVFLIEIEQTTPGADLTPSVDAAMRQVAELVRRRWQGLLGDDASSRGRPSGPLPLSVEITVDGNLRMSAEMADEYFPASAMVAVPRGDELWLMPLVGPESGGLLLKQRNSRGDRSALIWESLPPGASYGIRAAVWDRVNAAMRVSLNEGVTTCSS